MTGVLIKREDTDTHSCDVGGRDESNASKN